MAQFAVLHVEKCKGNLTGIGQHIDRQEFPFNADPERAHLNMHIIKPSDNLTDDVNARIAEGYKGKKGIRKDAVKALRYVLTGSHERMKELEAKPQDFEKWVKSNFDFLAEKHGRENIVRFSVHMDETTPHIHAVVVPLTRTGGLSTKEMLGGPSELKALQSDYAQKMEAFGLSRGLDNSPAKHTDIKEYYAVMNEELPNAKEELRTIRSEISSKEAVKSIIDKLTGKGELNKLKNENKALKSEILTFRGEMGELVEKVQNLGLKMRLLGEENSNLKSQASEMKNSTAATKSQVQAMTMAAVNAFLKKSKINLKLDARGIDSPAIVDITDRSRNQGLKL